MLSPVKQWEYTNKKTIWAGSLMIVHPNAVVRVSEYRMSGTKVSHFLYHDVSQQDCVRHLESGKPHYLRGSQGRAD